MARYTDRYWINQHNATIRARSRALRLAAAILLAVALGDAAAGLVMRHYGESIQTIITDHAPAAHETAATAAILESLGNRP